MRVAELIEIVHMLARLPRSSAATSSRSPTPGIRAGRTGIAASWVIREAMLAWWGDDR